MPDAIGPMPGAATRPEELARLLAGAWREKTQAAVPPALAPQDNADAYRVQQAFLHQLGSPIGGWKVGAKSADGPIQGAPLPQAWIHPDAAMLPRTRFPVLGIELEIMFRLGRDFLPGAPPPGEDEVREAIAGVAASIEIVSSRLAGWPDVPKPSQLADLQNHGALVVGEWVGSWDGIDFLTPRAQLAFNGREVFAGAGGNPAGDPRRLLHWVVRHCHAQGIPLPAGTPITAGSYTGMFFPQEAGTVEGRIGALPPIRFDIV